MLVSNSEWEDGVGAFHAHAHSARGAPEGVHPVYELLDVRHLARAVYVVYVVCIVDRIIRQCNGNHSA